jgi:nucleotide-binding universal stress UspA family protein
MYDRILVPTDGSHGSTVALDHALELAAAHDATVHSLYVVSPSRVDGLSRLDEAVEGMSEYGDDLAENAARRADKRGIDCETALRRGVPNEEILDYAEETDADLIVMGTHGRTGLERYLLGSVTERVVRAATVPVMTMTPDTAPDVEDAETAVEVAREALEREGHEAVRLEDPHRGANTWVVRAETDGGTFNVHVGTDGATHVARLGEN